MLVERTNIPYQSKKRFYIKNSSLHENCVKLKILCSIRHIGTTQKNTLRDQIPFGTILKFWESSILVIINCSV